MLQRIIIYIPAGADFNAHKSPFRRTKTIVPFEGPSLPSQFETYGTRLVRFITDFT